MRSRNLLLAAMAAATLAASTAAAETGETKKSRDMCVVDVASGFPLNYFVFRDVAPIALNAPVALEGLYFPRTRIPAPLHGSAVLVSDGSVRIGFFVHSSAVPVNATPNDFTISGKVDENFAGIVTFDNDGDFLPNGSLDLRVIECATVPIP